MINSWCVLNPIYRGDSREYTLNFTNSDGDKIDITGWKVFFTMKQYYSDNDDKAVIKKDIETHYDPTNGQTKIILLPSDTENLIRGTYYYDVQVKRAEQNIITVLSGTIEVRPDVTRRID
jgi:hypothetical protein